MNSVSLFRSTLKIILFALCLSSAQTNAASYTGSLSYTHDNNLTLGYQNNDILSDDIITAGLNISHTLRIDTMNSVALSLSPQFSSYAKYDGLNNTSLDLSARYIFQFSNHFRAPQFQLHLSTGIADYENDLRDNTHNQYGLTINFNFDDRTLLRAGISNDTSNADATFDPGTSNTYQTFDTSRSTTYLGINITQTRKLSLYASYSLIKGDIVANWRDSTFASIPPATVIAWETIPDTVYANNWSSTKYHADTSKIAIGFNFAFSQQAAIDAVFESLDADAGNYSYKIERMSLSYLQRF